jgi:hypothetical protein
VLQIVLTETGGVRLRIGSETLPQAIIDVPVRCVDRDRAVLVSMLCEEAPQLIALLRRLAFLQIGEAEQRAKTLEVLDERVAAQDIGGILGKIAAGIEAM